MKTRVAADWGGGLWVINARSQYILIASKNLFFLKEYFEFRIKRFGSNKNPIEFGGNYLDGVVRLVSKVLSQQMVSTPVTELDSDIVQKDRRNKPDFSI